MIYKLRNDQATQSSINTTSPRNNTKNVTEYKYEHHKHKDNKNRNTIIILQRKNLITFRITWRWPVQVETWYSSKASC